MQTVRLNLKGLRIDLYYGCADSLVLSKETRRNLSLRPSPSVWVNNYSTLFILTILLLTMIHFSLSSGHVLQTTWPWNTHDWVLSVHCFLILLSTLLSIKLYLIEFRQFKPKLNIVAFCKECNALLIKNAMLCFCYQIYSTTQLNMKNKKNVLRVISRQSYRF